MDIGIHVLLFDLCLKSFIAFIFRALFSDWHRIKNGQCTEYCDLFLDAHVHMRICAHNSIIRKEIGRVLYTLCRRQCDKNENMLARHLVFTWIHTFFWFFYCFSHKCTHIHSSNAFYFSYQSAVATIYSAHHCICHGLFFIAICFSGITPLFVRRLFPSHTPYVITFGIFVI